MKYRKYVYGIVQVKLENKKTGYKVNILKPGKHYRVSGGIWESLSEANREAKKFINDLIKGYR